MGLSLTLQCLIPRSLEQPGNGVITPYNVSFPGHLSSLGMGLSLTLNTFTLCSTFSSEYSIISLTTSHLRANCKESNHDRTQLTFCDQHLTSTIPSFPTNPPIVWIFSPHPPPPTCTCTPTSLSLLYVPTSPSPSLHTQQAPPPLYILNKPLLLSIY